MDNELKKMLNGEMYFPFGEELSSMRDKAKKLYQEFNVTYDTELLKKLFE